MTKSKLPKGTIKFRKWYALYLEGSNATEAAWQAYDCGSRASARQIGYENLTKLDYEGFMEDCGVTDKLLQQRLKEGLNATDSRTVKVDGEDEVIETPNEMIRHKYMETGLKLKKRLIDRKDITSGGEPILGAKAMANKLDEIMKEDDTEAEESDKSGS